MGITPQFQHPHTCQRKQNAPFQRLGGQLFEKRNFDRVLVRVARRPGVALLVKDDSTAERLWKYLGSHEALRAVVGDIIDERAEIRHLLEQREYAALHARFL